MRTGLVIVGLVIVIVGAAVFITIVLNPPTHTVAQITDSQFTASAAPNGSTGGHAGEVKDVPQGSYVLSWLSNASVGLSFYDSIGCHVFVNNTCEGTPIVSWPPTVSTASYANTSSLTCPCYAILTNPHGFVVGVNGHLFVTATTSVWSLTEWSYAAVLFCSLILLLIGGLALFLGLFLRGHVFRSDQPPGPGEEGFIPEGTEEYDEEPVDGPEEPPTGPRTGHSPGEGR